MTKSDKARAIVRLFERGRDADAYMAMEFMLKEREWPAWLTQTARDIDSVTKDRPTNLQEAA